MRTTDEILALIKNKVANERALGIEILHLLFEVKTRQIHLELGFPSLHEFCVRELKYSDGAAFRRIKAMQLIHEIPETEAKLNCGALTLSAAASAQNYFKQSGLKCPAAQRDVLAKLEYQSTREVERTLASLAGIDLKIKIELDSKTFELLEELGWYFSHNTTAGSLRETIQLLAVEELLRQKKKRFGAPATENQNCVASAPKLRGRTRYISAEIRRAVFERDQTCTYIHPLTERRCAGAWRLEIDHIRPFSRGGSHNVDNLRVLCDEHNRWRSKGEGR